MRGGDIAAQINKEWDSATQDADQEQIPIRVHVIHADLRAQFFDARLKRLFVNQDFGEYIFVILHFIVHCSHH